MLVTITFFVIYSKAKMFYGCEGEGPVIQQCLTIMTEAVDAQYLM